MTIRLTQRWSQRGLRFSFRRLVLSVWFVFIFGLSAEPRGSAFGR